MPEPFNARDLHIWKPDRLYRVYCGRDHIDWIQVSGQNWGLTPVLRSQLGPLGELIAGVKPRNRLPPGLLTNLGLKVNPRKSNFTLGYVPCRR